MLRKCNKLTLIGWRSWVGSSGTYRHSVWICENGNLVVRNIRYESEKLIVLKRYVDKCVVYGSDEPLSPGLEQEALIES